MASSYAGRSQSNIYLDDPDSYHPYRSDHNRPPEYTASTMNMPMTVAHASNNGGLASGPFLKNATSLQQLQTTATARPTTTLDPRTTMMDQDQSSAHQQQNAQQQQQQQSTLSIPDVFEQQLMHERLMCIQQMMASGQTFASMFNDDPQFVQQIMSYLPPGRFYQPQEEPEIMEITEE